MESLKKHGWSDIPPLNVAIQNSIRSGDKGAILRAFSDAIYSAYWDMDEVIPVIEAYLKNPDPYVRYLAAQSLFTVGDQSGYQTLLDLVESKAPIEGLGEDVRIAAAKTLAQFRQAGVVQAIVELNKRSPDADLVIALSTLGAQLPNQRQLPFRISALAMAEYAQINADWFVPNISEVFQHSSNSDLKAAAAWSLASMTGDKAAIDYLAQAAQRAIQPKGTSSEDENQPNGTDVLKYLGTIQTPEAKQTLEAALSSPDPHMKEIATVNLLFNQGGSDKAIETIAQQLEGTVPPSQCMSWDLIFNIVVQFRDNPTIAAAGEKYAARSQDGSWRRFVEQRANWPIYDWIDNYVVKLNSPP